MSENAEKVPESVAAQVAEATEGMAEVTRLKTKTVTVCGQQWQIPAKPSVGYLYDISRIDGATDDGRVRAVMDTTLTLLGESQFVRFRHLDAEDATDQLFEAASKAYGVSGN